MIVLTVNGRVVSMPTVMFSSLFIQANGDVATIFFKVVDDSNDDPPEVGTLILGWKSVLSKPMRQFCASTCLIVKGDATAKFLIVFVSRDNKSSPPEPFPSVFCSLFKVVKMLVDPISKLPSATVNPLLKSC